MKPFPSLNDIYSLIIEKDRQQGFSRVVPPNHDTIAMIASPHLPSSKSIVVVPRHNFTSGPKERPYCTYCN